MSESLGRGRREEGGGKREEGRGRREEGGGKREEGRGRRQCLMMAYSPL